MYWLSRLGVLVALGLEEFDQSVSFHGFKGLFRVNDHTHTLQHITGKVGLLATTSSMTRAQTCPGSLSSSNIALYSSAWQQRV